MEFIPGNNYNVAISSAALTQSNSGTPGVQINFELEGAAISASLWLTEKTTERVQKTLTDIGLSEQQLRSPSLLENIGSVLTGKECNITIVQEEYPVGSGKWKTKVSYINPKRDLLAPSQLAGQVAHMFGGAAPVAAPPVARQSQNMTGGRDFEAPPPEDDLPF